MFEVPHDTHALKDINFFWICRRPKLHNNNFLLVDTLKESNKNLDIGQERKIETTIKGCVTSVQEGHSQVPHIVPHPNLCMNFLLLQHGAYYQNPCNECSNH